jgi:hypothetical protein
MLKYHHKCNKSNRGIALKHIYLILNKKRKKTLKMAITLSIFNNFKIKA